jgi:HEAT repeat protein
MADSTLKRLISLIESEENAEVRRAAVRVAAALKLSKEHGLNQALLGVLQKDDPGLRGLAVEALGAARAEEALPHLVRLLAGGGPEVEATVGAIGLLGARGTRALGQIMHEAAPVLRRRIAAALALVGTESAVLATAESLRDEDPGVVEASAKSLALEVPLLTAGQKRALADHLLLMLNASAGRPPPRNGAGSKQAKKKGSTKPELARKLARTALGAVSEAAVLRVLAALHAPEAGDIYWARLEADQPAHLRAAALQALAAMEPPSSEAKLQQLLKCAAAAEFQVVAPALMLLRKVPASRKNVKHWLRLLDAPDVAAHVVAVEKLREVDNAEVARALLRQLHHPDKELRTNALSALGELKSGRDALFAALLESQTPDEAWTLARGQVQSARQWSAAQRQKLFTMACQAHEADDRRSDAMWHLLREVDSDKLRRQIQERALALRKKKNFTFSLAYWRLLTRDPAVGAELRFELAATALKISNHDTAAAHRDADPALHQFNRLLQDPAFNLVKHVLAARWLEESDLFYLGFHFAEQPRLAREFGREVLKAVIERWPKTQSSKNAKQKLRSEGLNG